MKAWLLPQIGSLDNLKLSDAPDPTPAAGEVLLRVVYCALNPADYYLAEGQYPARPTLPHILGRDGVGIVEAVGDGVTDWRVGDQAVLVRSEVGVNRAGALAEKVVVPAVSLVKPPAGWTTEEAACAALVYLTAWQAIDQWGDLPSNAVVLITGVSGGVGVAATHLAKARGFTVIGTSRGTSKHAALREQGVDFIVDPSDTQWRRRVKAFLGEKKVDLAIDNIGGAFFSEMLDVMGMWGRISCVGRLAGPVPSFNTASLFFRRLKIGGVSVGTYTPDESRAAWARVVETLARNNRRPLVDSVYAFDQLPAAFMRLKEGPLGKVLIRVGAVA